MKLLRRHRLIFFVLLPLLLLTTWLCRDTLRDRAGDWLLSKRLPIVATHSSVLNVLDDRGWLIYARPPGTPSMLFIFNAGLAVPSRPACQPAPEWAYGVAYELRDSSGRPLRAASFHFSTRLPGVKQPGTGEWMPGSSFDTDAELLPSMADQGTVDFSATPTAAYLALRMVNNAPEVREVGLRAYSEQAVREGQRLRTWLHLPRKDQERLASATAFPAQLLSETEIQRLVVNRWLPLGPSRADSGEFRTRRLFVADLPPLPLCTRSLPSGLLLDAGFPLTLPLPPDVARPRLHLEALQARRVTLSLRWRGTEVWQRKTQTQILDLPADVLLDFPPGEVELETDQPAMLSLQAADASGALQDVTPPPQFQATYRVTAGQTLRYALSAPGAGQIQPLRVDLRQLQQQAGDAVAGPVAVTLRLLDAEGRILDEQQRTLELLPARGERPGLDPVTLRNSAAATLYLQAPGTAAALEIVSDHLLWAQLRSRPAALPQRFKVPQDLAVWRDASQAQPMWFTLEPQGAAQLQSRETRQLVEYRTLRNPDDPELLAGRYAWAALEPERAASGEVLALRRDAQQPWADRLAGGLYRPLPADGKLELRAEPGLPYSQPRLIGLHATDAPAQLEVSVDGRPVLSRPREGGVSWLRLPPLTPGTHQLSFGAATGANRWYVNQSSSDSGEVLQQLFAWKLPAGQSQTFTADLDGSAQILTVRLYYQRPMMRRLRLQLLGPEPQRGWRTDWTQRLREYEITPGAPQQAWLLTRSSATPALAGGERLVLPIAADLPAGRYRLQITSLEGDECLLNVYRTQPGLHNDERLSRSAYSQED